MRRMLLFAGVAAGALLIAAGLRARDAPYIAYERGDVSGAMAGLTRKAEDGDGFAAYLIARSHYDRRIESASLRTATAWYVAAARAGEIRAVADFIRIVLASHPSAETCTNLTSQLELASRAGDAGALITAGDLYEYGRCGTTDLTRAASYYAAAVRLDRRLGAFQERVLAKLPSEEAARVSPIPFDIDAREVLARFVSEAPALLPDSLR